MGVEWSDGRQGLEGQIERYRNSAMMHASVADEARPIMLQNGVRVPFPAPTQPLKPLRVRMWKKNASGCLQLHDSTTAGAEVRSQKTKTDALATSSGAFPSRNRS